MPLDSTQSIIVAITSPLILLGEGEDLAERADEEYVVIFFLLLCSLGSAIVEC